MKEGQIVERSQEQLDAIQTLLRMYKTGIGQENLVGYHGFSLETIQYAINSQGIIPGTTNPDASAPSGSLFFAATTPDAFEKIQKSLNKDFVAFIRKHGVFHSPESGYNTAHVFAEDGAKIRGLISGLGLDPTKDEHVRLVLRLLNILPDSWEPRRERRADARSALHEMGISDAVTVKALHQARKMQGIVMGVSKKIVEDFPLLYGNSSMDYAAVNENGFSLEYFTGLECQGTEEQAFFEELEKEVESLL